MKIRSTLLLSLLLFSSIIVFTQCKKDDPDVVLTDELAFTDAEKALIYSNNNDSIMRIMNYFLHEDSLVLRKQSINVNFNDTATLNHLIDRMNVTVRAAGGIGIAAPQVGINRNIIWVQRLDKGTITNHPWEVYLNPIITRYSDTTKLRDDGCLSLPGIETEKSWRAIWINIEYDLPDGSHQSEHISHQYTAHIFQHEIDHLNGIVFIDRLTQ